MTRVGWGARPREPVDVRWPACVSDRTRGWLLCGLAAVLFGASTPFAKLLADDAGPDTLAGFLYLGAGLSVLPVLARARTEGGGRRRAWDRLVVAVVLGGGVAPVCVVLALQRVPAPTVSLLLNLELAATVLIAWLLLREHVGRSVVLGVGCIVGASVLLGGTTPGGAGPATLLVALACLCWGVDNSVTAALDTFTPAQITAAKGWVAGPVNVALGLALGQATGGVGVAFAALAVGALGYGLSITMWIAGARAIGASRGQAIFATAPFVGALVARPVAGDAISTAGWLAMALAALGVSLTMGRGHGHEHVHVPVAHVHRHRHDRHHRHGHEDPSIGEDTVHTHWHEHERVRHVHPHEPDLHHRHRHDAA